MISIIKKKMIDAGRDDFITYLSELLECSKSAASNKLSGKSDFTISELSIITRKLGFTAEDLKSIVGADGVESERMC